MGIPKKDLVQIRVGVCAVIWKIWNTRNNLSLPSQKTLFLQDIPIATHWIRIWSYLQQEE
jgi:hypothetical protein